MGRHKARRETCRLRDTNGQICRRLAESPVHATHEPGCKFPERAHHLFSPRARKPAFISTAFRTSLFLSDEDRAFLMEHGGITDGVRRLIARERLIEKRIDEALAAYEPPPPDDIVV